MDKKTENSGIKKRVLLCTVNDNRRDRMPRLWLWYEKKKDNDKILGVCSPYISDNMRLGLARNEEYNFEKKQEQFCGIFFHLGKEVFNFALVKWILIEFVEFWKELKIDWLMKDCTLQIRRAARGPGFSTTGPKFSTHPWLEFSVGPSW